MSRTAIRLTNGTLAVLCCLLVARAVTEGAREAPAASAAEVAAAGSTDSPVARGGDQRQGILTRNLFDVPARAPATAEPAPEEEEVYEPTSLPLVLLGTVAGTPENTWAAVEDLDTNQRLVVRVDDELLERAEVIRIERRRIVLRNAGKLEELALNEDALDTPEQRIHSRLLSQARILPKYAGGQMAGVELSAIEPGSLFEQIGIQNGDVVTQLNGIRVRDPQDITRVLGELASAKEFEVTVHDESGATHQLRYEGRRATEEARRP